MKTLAASVEGSNPLLNIGIFALFVIITLVIVFRASRNTKTASDYYAAGRAFTGPQNGIAISGDYLSAASFLGIAGAIAVHGYDGFLYSIGFLVAWLVALLLIAEGVRNTGRFTMGDVLAYRMRQRPVRAAAAIRTGRCLRRNDSTSAIVNRPVFRSSSATSSSATSQATRNPIE